MLYPSPFLCSPVGELRLLNTLKHEEGVLEPRDHKGNWQILDEVVPK
jgi:hypothetical protein